MALCLFALLAFEFVISSQGLPGGFHHRAPFKTSGPYSIAHRGANGEFPESTVPAFKRAIQEGIDIIETDIGATKDGFLICLHDTTLDAITDVAQRPEFASRRATYPVEGENITGFFAVDFTLDEIKSLRVHQRYEFRDQAYNGMYQIPTFEEYIAIALEAPRVVGIDPEIKNPVFINKHVKWPHGKLFEDKYVQTLLKYGYNAPYLSESWLQQPIFIQSFAPLSILRVANQTKSPKIFNIGRDTDLAQDTLQPYSELSSDAYLDFIKSYVAGISMDKNTIAPIDETTGRLSPPSDIVDRAHVRGLMIHPATFRNEAQFMAKDFRADPYREFDYFLQGLRVDAVMTDFPSTLTSYMNAIAKSPDLWKSCEV